MRTLMCLMLVLTSLPSFAQKDELFGDGKPLTFREEVTDKRFARSRVAKLMNGGTDNPGCVQLLGGLFVALAEIGPMLHKRDVNFYLHPELVAAVNTQLSTPNFPAMSYLISMVRRVMIDKRLPDAWLETATKLNQTVKIIDLAKLKALNDGVVLIDNSAYQIPLLRQRYAIEVAGANSAVTADVAQQFSDSYIDRDIGWFELVLIDAGLKKSLDKKSKLKPSEMNDLVAVLQWLPPDPRKRELDFYQQKTAPIPVKVVAHLAPRQFFEIEKALKGQRMLIRGRFTEMNTDATVLQVNDAQLFDDRDWNAGVVLGRPADIATCPAAVNELTGINPDQPGGFKH